MGASGGSEGSATRTSPASGGSQPARKSFGAFRKTESALAGAAPSADAGAGAAISPTGASGAARRGAGAMWRDGLLENRDQRRRLAQTQNRLAAPPPSAPPAPLAPSLQADASAGEQGAAGGPEIVDELMGTSAMSDALSRCHDVLTEGSSAAAAPYRSAGGLSAWYNEISTDNFGYASAALGFGGFQSRGRAWGITKVRHASTRLPASLLKRDCRDSR